MTVACTAGLVPNDIWLPVLSGCKAGSSCQHDNKPAVGARAGTVALEGAAGEASKWAGPHRLGPPAPLRVSCGSALAAAEGAAAAAAGWAAETRPASPCTPASTAGCC